MQNMSVKETSRCLCLSILFISLILMVNNVIAATQKTTNWLDKPISISFQNEPLSKVLKQISEQTGVSIAYDQELANEKVTGNYQNVKTSDAITRLFRSKNKSIQVNKAKKIIIVKTFGAKNFIWVNSNQVSLDKVRNSSLMTIAELEELHAQQYKEYKERIANDNEILEGGITRGELRDMHDQQYKQFQTRLTDKNEKIAGQMTRAELNAMHKAQYKEYHTSIDDNATIEGSDNVTYGNLRAMHEQQYREYQTRINNEKKYENSISLDELNKMHEQQYKEYKQSL